MNPWFGKIFMVVGGIAGVLLVSPLGAENQLYTDKEADCAARIIFMNECSGKEENLIFWSPNEAFPSLGIGHFIWYPKGFPGPYKESFPDFLDFAEEKGLPVPQWVRDLPGRHAPWRTRRQFQRSLNGKQMQSLREFLSQTKREQAHFILRRFQKVFPTILDQLKEADRQPVQDKYDLLMERQEGVLAMIDYVNFKGEGLNTDARYHEGGWGVAQVLMEMKLPKDPDKAIHEFVLAAERVLERRVRHSPRPEIERKWLPGWKNRLNRYLTVSC